MSALLLIEGPEEELRALVGAVDSAVRQALDATDHAVDPLPRTAEAVAVAAWATLHSEGYPIVEGLLDALRTYATAQLRRPPAPEPLRPWPVGDFYLPGFDEVGR